MKSLIACCGASATAPPLPSEVRSLNMLSRTQMFPSAIIAWPHIVQSSKIGLFGRSWGLPHVPRLIFTVCGSIPTLRILDFGLARLEDWHAHNRDSAPTVQLDEVTLAPAVARPSKLICVGLNYAALLALLVIYVILGAQFSDPSQCPQSNRRSDEQGETGPKEAVQVHFLFTLMTLPCAS